jgi:GntR family glv operon transcriptional regulator
VIYKKIATELKARINSDDYAVGDMLPSEKALAAELQVSVMTLRKALALLEEKADRAAARQRNLHCA